MSTSAISRVSAGVPAGGRFATIGRPEAEEEFGAPGGECGSCGNPSDQDEGIPCSNCLDDTCACGASLNDGEGYDGQCGSCADQDRNEAVPYAPEPERLHGNMGDGPIVTSPSGQYGFYTPINGSEKAAGIDKYGPVVQVAQLVRGGQAWNPTPARFHASSVADYRPGATLAIDMGAGWALSTEDTQALAAYGQAQLDDAKNGQPAVVPEPAAPKLTVPTPITEHDKEVATTIYRQIGPVVAGNMDAKARNTFAITNGVRMTGCRSGARKRVDVTVTLNGGDLYDVDVVTTQTLKADSKPVAQASNVHVSQLQGLMLKIGDGHPEEIAA